MVQSNFDAWSNSSPSINISEYDPMIVWWDNVLDVNFCRRCIRKFNNDEANQLDGHTFGGYRPEIKQSKDLAISKHAHWKEEDAKLFVTLGEYLTHYSKYCNENFGMTVYANQDSGYQIQKTVPGGFYHWHHDGHFRGKGDARVLTYIWYLNTCQKGNTEFSCGESIEPKLGRLLLFPSTWDRIHRGTPPETVKYICTGWMYENTNYDETPTE